MKFILSNSFLFWFITVILQRFGILVKIKPTAPAQDELINETKGEKK